MRMKDCGVGTEKIPESFEISFHLLVFCWKIEVGIEGCETLASKDAKFLLQRCEISLQKMQTFTSNDANFLLQRCETLLQRCKLSLQKMQTFCFK
jgi:hypothetical protein